MAHDIRALVSILNIELRQSFRSTLRRVSFPVAAGLGAFTAVYPLGNLVSISFLAAFCCAGLGIALTMKRGAWFSRLAVWFSVGLVWGAGSVLATNAGKFPDALYSWQITSLSGWSIKDARKTASGNTALDVAVSSLACRQEGVEVQMEFPRLKTTNKAANMSTHDERRPQRHGFSERGFNALLIIDAEPDIAAGELFTAQRPNLIPADTAMFFIRRDDFSSLGPVSRLAVLRKSARKTFQDIIRRISGRAFPLADALLLGIRNDLDANVTAWFRDSGCAHILALSGQHLSILCSLISFIIAKTMKKPKLAGWLSLFFAILFVGIAGFSPSLLRALLMFGIGAVTAALDRPQPPLAILSLAFLLALLFQPAESKSLGFMLSYLAMIGLIVFSEPLGLFISNFPIPDVLAKVLTASVSALCATSLVSVTTFGRLPLIGIITSALAGPVLLAFMWLLLAGSVICSVLPPLACLFIPIHEYLASMLLAIMKTGALVPALSAEKEPGRSVICTGIVLICLFVYAYPLLEYAFFEARQGHKKKPP